MSAIQTELATNKHAWDQVAPKFAGACALPDWGPFGECRSLDLLGNLDGVTVLEVGCGSGHSIAHAAERGAASIYGIDISTTQIALAAQLNRAHIDAGRVHLIESPMEEPLDLRGIDLIFSIYAIGWTCDPVATFRNLAAYLKAGGRLVWSWGIRYSPRSCRMPARSSSAILIRTSTNNPNSRHAGVAAMAR